MPSNKPIMQTRTDQQLIDKMKVIAKRNRRSLAGEVEFICQQHVAAYEHQHGPIVLPAAPQGTDPADEHS